MNRPEVLNALPLSAHVELADVFDAFFAESDLWVAILTGAGGRAFSVGMDLREVAEHGHREFPSAGFAGITARGRMDKPVIAAVNGYALGGGFEAALACHLIVADHSAQFGLPEVRVGQVAGAGGVVRLPLIIPEKRALEMIITGRRMEVTEADSLGLINRITPKGAALDGARVLAREILSCSPAAVRLSLELVGASRAFSSIPDAVVYSLTTASRVLADSADAKEGAAAFSARREPRWVNR